MQQVLNSETVYDGWVKVVRLTLLTSGDATVQREIVGRRPAACVLPYDPVRRMALLVRQHRPAVAWAGGPAELLEAPAGVTDPGETGELTARREALEEVGVRLSDIEAVVGGWPSPGAYAERIDLFLAAYSILDRTGQGGGLEAEHEEIEVVELPLAELWAEVEAGRIVDLKTLALVLTLKARRPDLFT